MERLPIEKEIFGSFARSIVSRPLQVVTGRIYSF
jgi:hypothetical protein